MTLEDLKEDTLKDEELIQPKPAEHIGELDLRVGEIKECRVHELDETLYIETIDIGEPNPRLASSELVCSHKAEELVGRHVVVLCNANTVHQRCLGVNTHRAMLVCAENAGRLDPLQPPPGSVPGDLVTVEGYTRQPFPVLKYPEVFMMLVEFTPFAGVNADLRVNSLGQAVYKEQPLTVPGKDGFVTAPTFIDCPIKFE